jgi:hypothetical protein
MKVFRLVISLVTCCWIHGQGTLDFQLQLTGGGAFPLPAGSWRTTGRFTANVDNSFRGSIELDHSFSFGVTSIHAYSGPDATAPGTERMTFNLFATIINEPPVPSYRIYTGQTPITSADWTDLLAGKWSVNVTTTEFPDSALRGQIVPVPEPGTMLLLTTGLITLIATRPKLCDRRRYCS